MFTDMVGYTSLIQADEQTAVDKRDRYWRALEGYHDAFGGTVVQWLDDGSMSMFPSSPAAVDAAVAIQRELGAQDVSVRIGIHVGLLLAVSRNSTGRRRGAGKEKISGCSLTWSRVRVGEDRSREDDPKIQKTSWDRPDTLFTLQCAIGPGSGVGQLR